MPPTKIAIKTIAPETLNPTTRRLSTTRGGEEDEKVVFIIVLFVINFFVVFNASVVVKADLSVVTRLGRVVGTWEGTKRVRVVLDGSVLDVVLDVFSVVIVGRGVVVETSGKGTKRVVGSGEGIKRVIIAVLDAASVVLDVVVVAAALVRG